MALIKTVNELQAIFPKLVSNLNQDTQLPVFAIAEIKYLVPIIGMGLYNDIQAKYDAVTLSPKETQLLKHIQILVAANTFRDELIINQVILTDQGWKAISTQEMGKLVGWEYKELKSFFLDKSADAEEVALTYLWANEADFPLWTASVEYTQFKSLLIRNGSEFRKQYRSVYQPMRTYYQLQPIVAEVQEMYLQDSIGQALLQYLRDTAAPTDTEKNAIAMLKKALAYFTIKHACMQMPIRISDSGLTVNSQYGDKEDAGSAGREGASASMIEKLQNDSNKEGQNWLSKARYTLYQHRNSLASSVGFNAAFDAGKLKGYIPPSDRTSGNEDRKFFVL